MRPPPITIKDSATGPLSAQPKGVDPVPSEALANDWSNTQLDANGNIINIELSTTYTPHEAFDLLKNTKEVKNTLPNYILDHILLCMTFKDSVIIETGEISSPHRRKVLSIKAAQEALQPLHASNYDLAQWVPAPVLKHLGFTAPE